ncbi:hypothetical protein SKAU_G00340450 [Synaphobranchus kaupii]|uniref:Fibronectin type-III domain-containing protein n=1 Tax=Synaphobranchus kaupii TaxID=118154 RepID=A0A9Q1EN00_SYNKA|nr:hypothetical protein SKAU_G00340450 [Synaphobranchus kaupii]
MLPNFPNGLPLHSSGDSPPGINRHGKAGNVQRISSAVHPAQSISNTATCVQHITSTAICTQTQSPAQSVSSAAVYVEESPTLSPEETVRESQASHRRYHMLTLFSLAPDTHLNIQKRTQKPTGWSRQREKNTMSLLLICVLTLNVFWEGGCQRGDEQFPQFNFTSLDTTTTKGRLPDSNDSLILRNQAEDTSGSTPPSITKVVSHEDSGTSTPPTITTPSRTPSLERENDEETKAPSVHSKAPTTQMPSLTSAGSRPGEHVIHSPDDLDYHYDEEDEEEVRNKGRGDMPKCKHDPCAHLQWPCLEVSQGNCMCPGLTPDSVNPSPPLTVDAQDVTASSAEVQWCAPYSFVSGYELHVREEASGSLTSHALDPTFRRFRVSGLRESRAYTVCVTAKNRAGSSPPVCTALTTSRNGAVVTYALAAAVAGIALLALVLTVCLCRQCRKPPPESQRNTSLISIPNPAYYHPQETADILKV